MQPLYALAAERTLAHLGDPSQQELADALADILKLRDANLPDCESLIAGMLARRDQWLLVLPVIMHTRTAMGGVEGETRRALPPRARSGD